jgi:hypothetical protein
MSATKEMADRFWRTMGERFGKRWLDEYGAQPTTAWKRAIGAYSPEVIGAALDLMHTRGWQHPPTEPQFAQLLSEAARKSAGSSENHRRGFWRSLIVAEIGAALGYQRDYRAFELVVIQSRHDLGHAMAALLNECENLEITTGQRTDGQLVHCAEQCRLLAANYAGLRRVAA